MAAMAPAITGVEGVTLVVAVAALLPSSPLSLALNVFLKRGRSSHHTAPKMSRILKNKIQIQSIPPSKKSGYISIPSPRTS